MISTVSSVKSAQTSQAVTSDSGGGQNTESAGNSDFDVLLKGYLAPDQSGNVSEEELFAALVGERISALKGKDAAESYKAALESNKTALKKADGFVPHEDAAIKTLQQLVDQQVISREEGNKIYAEAFDGAQLDGNKTALYDGRGGANDPTIAIAKIDAAILAAKALMDQFASGTLTAAARELTTAAPTGSVYDRTATASGVTSVSAGAAEIVTPTGNTVDGAEGFLWKPVTNNEGRLAVLLGAEVTGRVLSVVMKDKEGNVIEEGRLQSAGIVETGREKYVFNKAGGNYPRDVQVEVTFSDGSAKIYNISDPAQRYD